MEDRPPAPATGSSDPEDTEIRPGEEAWIPGTIFITMFILIAIAGGWLVVFVMLFNR